MKSRHTDDLTEENLGYYTGTSAFENWVGPGLKPENPKYEEVMGVIAKVFQSRSVIRECIDRTRTALVGKKPHWYFVDPMGDRVENDSASTAEKLLQQFINRQARLAISQETQLQDAVAEAVKNMLVTGRGYLRLWSPRRYRNSDDPVMRVCMHSPHPTSVSVERDTDGFVTVIQYTYTDSGETRKERQFVDPGSGLTFFVTLDKTDAPIPEESFYLDLGGRYSVYELRSPPLITDSVKRAQNAINFALTMMVRSVEVGGFRERLILGAQPPGRWDDDGKFHPDTQFSIGPGQTSFIQGVPLTDEAGQLKGYTSPSVNYAEPVSPQTFIDTVQAFVALIYHEFKQGHLLGSDLQLSGVSREQSRQDFETSLGTPAQVIESGLGGIYACAVLMMTQPVVEQYRDLDVAVQLRLSASKPLPSEQEQLLKFQQANLLSRTTAITLSGFTDDPDGEQALLMAEERERNAVNETSSLVTAGILDQPESIRILQRRGILPADSQSSDLTGEVLNGNRVGG